MIGIYCIKSRIDEKRYFGQSKNIRRRLNDHKSALFRNAHTNLHLQRAWNKYGEENFEFSIVLECSINDLDKHESFYISKYRTILDEFGYNLESGGNRNKNLSLETRQKLSNSRLGKSNMTDAAKQRLSQRMKGTAYRLGSKMSENNKQKLVESHKGNKYTLGYRHTDEAKKKMSEHRKGNQFRKGIHHSEETKKKISESLKKWRESLINSITDNH